jgi:hypothetical protein
MKRTYYNSAGLTDEENAVMFRLYGAIVTMEQVRAHKQRLCAVRRELDEAIDSLTCTIEEAEEKCAHFWPIHGAIERRVGHDVIVTSEYGGGQ